MAIKDWSTTAANNDDADASINWLENQAPSTVNNSARAMMAVIRTWYEDVEWRDWGHTVTRTGNTTFTIATDVTSIYVANRPIRCADSSTLYGYIASSSYSAPDTTVTVTLDSGNLSASLTAVSLGLDPGKKSIDVRSVRGAVQSGSGTSTTSEINMSGAAVNFAEGADVASANDCDIWSAGDGNTLHVTGNTEIQDWGTAPQAGAFMWVILDGTPQLTYNATTNKLNTGGANYTASAGDRLLVYAETTTSFIVTIFPLDGHPVLGYPASQGCSVVLLETSTFSGVSAKDITTASIFNGTYDEIWFSFYKLQPSSDGSLYLRVSIDAGSTFASGASDYAHNLNAISSAAGDDLWTNTGQAYIPLNADAGSLTVATGTAAAGWNGTVKLFRPSATDFKKLIYFDGTYKGGAAASVQVVGSGSYITGNEAIGGIRIVPSIGTLSGSVYVSGVKKS